MFNNPFEVVIEEAEVNLWAEVELTDRKWSARVLRSQNIGHIHLSPRPGDMRIVVLRLFLSPISTRPS
jgi:hypothetical protein